MRKRNPTLKPTEYLPPSFTEEKEKRRAEKTKPEDLLPWRMFDNYGPQLCKLCGQTVEGTFIVTKSREMADELFGKGLGISSVCILNPMLHPIYRIKVLDRGRPNPPVTKVASVSLPEIKSYQAIYYRLFRFESNKLRECDCGKHTHAVYVTGIDRENARDRIERYWQCSFCMCQTLCFDRYGIERLDGREP